MTKVKLEIKNKKNHKEKRKLCILNLDRYPVKLSMRMNWQCAVYSGKSSCAACSKSGTWKHTRPSSSVQSDSARKFRCNPAAGHDRAWSAPASAAACIGVRPCRPRHCRRTSTEYPSIQYLQGLPVQEIIRERFPALRKGSMLSSQLGEAVVCRYEQIVSGDVAPCFRTAAACFGASTRTHSEIFCVWAGTVLQAASARW